MEPWLAELHRSEDHLRAVIESSPLAIMEVDLETRVIRWNRAAERIFGWTRDEMLGKAGDADGAALAAGRARGARCARPRRRIVRGLPDGPSAEGRDGLRGDDGGRARPGRGRHVVSHLVVYNDISVVKQQEARLQALIDSSPLALVEFGLETRVRRL